jgi:hypothetical protein
LDGEAWEARAKARMFLLNNLLAARLKSCPDASCTA